MTPSVVRPVYPLSAIVGQEALVESLLVCAVDPGVGGVLVRGERGTAKSTAVRGMAALLPDEGSVVEVPLGTTLDRLLGALDLGRALAGDAAYEPGLLVRADGGLLYVDEVNLLPDHLVDALLDAAATGVCRVEREAVSVVHDARFLLVGTMNAEEGELRPQLLDRFGLGVDVVTPVEPAVRAEVVRRRLAYEADPAGFVAGWSTAEAAVGARIRDARAALADVVLPEGELLRITGACAALGLDGVRGDVVCARAARVLAALDGAVAVDAGHVRRAALLALAHRRRRDPLEAAGTGAQDISQAVADSRPEGPDDGGGGGGDGGSREAGGGTGSIERNAPVSSGAPGANGSAADARAGGPAEGGAPAARPAEGIPDPERAALRARLALSGHGQGPMGRRGRGSGPQTGVIDTRPARPGDHDIAVVPTLLARAAAPARPADSTFRPPSDRNVDPAAPSAAEAPALRANVRAGREGALLVLVVDTSGSMAAQARLARVKGALLDTLRDAHARRDRVAIIAFHDRAARVVAAPGTPLERAAAAVRALPAGGRTPLAAGLDAAAELIERERVRHPARRALCVVLTDGRVPRDGGAARAAAARLGRLAEVHLVDTEDGPVRLGLAAPLAAAAGATVTTLSTIRRPAA